MEHDSNFIIQERGVRRRCHRGNTSRREGDSSHRRSSYCYQSTARRSGVGEREEVGEGGTVSVLDANVLRRRAGKETGLTEESFLFLLQPQRWLQPRVQFVLNAFFLFFFWFVQKLNFKDSDGNDTRTVYYAHLNVLYPRQLEMKFVHTYFLSLFKFPKVIYSIPSAYNTSPISV